MTTTTSRTTHLTFREMVALQSLKGALKDYGFDCWSAVDKIIGEYNCQHAGSFPSARYGQSALATAVKEAGKFDLPELNLPKEKWGETPEQKQAREELIKIEVKKLESWIEQNKAEHPAMYILPVGALSNEEIDAILFPQG